MKTFNEKAAAPSNGAAVSRPELERLEAKRRRPAPERSLTPDGMRHIAAAQAQQQEARLRHITARLEVAKDLAWTDFAIGQMRGVAKESFERTRE